MILGLEQDFPFTFDSVQLPNMPSEGKESVLERKGLSKATSACRLAWCWSADRRWWVFAFETLVFPCSLLHSPSLINWSLSQPMSFLAVVLPILSPQPIAGVSRQLSGCSTAGQHPPTATAQCINEWSDLFVCFFLNLKATKG